MNQAQIFKAGNVTGIFNDDTGTQVVRILLSGGLGSGEYDFIDTCCRLANAKVVFQECTFQPGTWNCGVRWYLDDDLAIQVVGLSNTLFWDYWQETIEPYLDTVLGTIYFLDAARPRWFYREALSRQYGLQYFQEWQGSPFLFACTEQTSTFFLAAEEIQQALKIPSEIPVVPCVATDKESVKSVLLALLEHARDRAATEDNPA
jgi:hypothetical protein